jgi:hypothetical protein
LLQPDPLWNGGETQNYGMQAGHYGSDESHIKVERRVGGGSNDYEIDDGTKINSFAFSGLYDMPFGKGKAFLSNNALLNRLVGDWRADYILTYYSGFTLRPTNTPDPYQDRFSTILRQAVPQWNAAFNVTSGESQSAGYNCDGRSIRAVWKESV